jgi:outer membrane protein OmpA-like peptidoglycan-associated protein
MIGMKLGGTVLVAVGLSCASSAATSDRGSRDISSRHNPSSATGPSSSAYTITAEHRPRMVATAMTSSERLLTTQRKAKLEEARDANADARRIALDFDHELLTLQGDATHEGILLRFSDEAFADGTTQLSGASRERLGHLVSFLDRHPESVVRIERSSHDLRGTDTRRRLSLGRTAAVEYYLAQSGIAKGRLAITISHARNDSIAAGVEGPIVHVIIEDLVSAKRGAE